MSWELVLAALLGLTGSAELAAADAQQPLFWVALVLMAAGLILRRQCALLGPVTIIAAFTLPLLLTGDPMPAFGDPPNSMAAGLLLLIGVYAAGAHPRLSSAIIGLATAMGMSVAHLLLTDPTVKPSLNDSLAALLVPTLLPWCGGLLVARQQRLREAEHQADELRLAAAEERSQIAREVHDLVAHSVSLMVVQAEAAEALLATSPTSTAESLRAVQQVGRKALGEMRRTVAALRAGGVTDQHHGLAALPSLLDSVRDAGLPVTVLTTGAPIELSPEVDASTYQVLCEALTNALRHTDHTGVTVRVAYEPQAVDVTVLDVGRSVARGFPGGHGLTGLHERITSLGGQLDAGPTSTGEHLVHAWLPA